MLYQHECHGHWPYDKGYDACVQARGRTPARRRKRKENQQTIGLAADYTFIAGRHWRLLVMLMLHTGMMGIVVVRGDRENDIKSGASVLNEIGVGGLTNEVATDNERYLVDMISRGLSKSSAWAYHWRNISEYRPQAKGVERAVCIAKEGIYSNWLAFEERCQCRIGLESPLLGYLTGYVYRTSNVFCNSIESLRMRMEKGLWMTVYPHRLFDPNLSEAAASAADAEPSASAPVDPMPEHMDVDLRGDDDDDDDS